MQRVANEDNDMNDEELIKKAIEYLPHSYAPYSKYHVAAALLCEDGTVYQGCNIENASYGATVCAERTAFFKAVSEQKGGRIPVFKKIAIVGGLGTDESALTDFASPCGICRQVMREFCDTKTFEIVLYRNPEHKEVGEIVKMTLEEMLPLSFGPEVLS